MNYCPNCGSPVLEDENYCPNCGKNLSERKNFQPSHEKNNCQKVDGEQTGRTIVIDEPDDAPPVVVKRKNSKLSIVAFICSLSIVLSPLGVLLAIIDLCRKKDVKRGLSIAALVIGGLIICAYSSSNSRTQNDESGSIYEGKNQYESSCETVNYEDVAREPNIYKGKRIKVTGIVIQESEGYNNSVTLRVASGTNGYDDIWYVTYTRADNEARLLEDDNVVIYGECSGTKTYKSVLGARITIPAVKARYVEIVPQGEK